MNLGELKKWQQLPKVEVDKLLAHNRIGTKPNDEIRYGVNPDTGKLDVDVNGVRVGSFSYEEVVAANNAP
jgi:hypothetical protein